MCRRLLAVVCVASCVVVVAEPLTLPLPPYSRQGVVMAPCKELVEWLGCRMEYDEEAGTISIVPVDGTDATVRLRIGEETATVDGGERSLPGPPELKDGVPHVPLRFMAEALGAEVTWSEERQGVTLVAGGRTATISLLRSAPAAGDVRAVTIPSEHPGPVADVAMTADGTRAAAVYHRGRVDVWDLRTRELLGSWSAFESGVSDDAGIVFSSDGSQLLAHNLGTVILAEAVTGEVVWRKWFELPLCMNRDVALAPDARAVAVAVRHVTRVPGVGQEAEKPAEPEEDPHYVEAVEVYESPGGGLLWRVAEKLEDVGALAVSAGGRRVAVAFESGGVRVWDGPSDAPRTIKTPDQYGTRLALADDGKLVFLGGRGISAWRYPELDRVPFPAGEAGRARVCADGTAAIVLRQSRCRGHAEVVTPDGATLGKTAPHLARLAAAAVSSHGRVALTGSVDGTVRAYETETGRELLSANESDTIVEFSLQRGRAVELSLEFPDVPFLAFVPMTLHCFERQADVPAEFDFRTLSLGVDETKGTVAVRVRADPDAEPGLYTAQVCYYFSLFGMAFFDEETGESWPKIFRIHVLP